MVIQPWVLVEQTDHRTDQAQLTAVAAARHDPPRLCRKFAFLRPNPKIGCVKINDLRD
jgi:hypothetical protein